jgi:hypothetical protein
MVCISFVKNLNSAIFFSFPTGLGLIVSNRATSWSATAPIFLARNLI